MDNPNNLKYTKDQVAVLIGEFDLRSEQFWYVFYNLNYGAEDERTIQYQTLCNEIAAETKAKYKDLQQKKETEA
jgi:hypothetical protein